MYGSDRGLFQGCIAYPILRRVWHYCLSYHIRKSSFCLAEIDHPAEKYHNNHRKAESYGVHGHVLLNRDSEKVEVILSEERPSKTFDHPHHRIETIKQLPPIGHDAQWVDDRG